MLVGVLKEGGWPTCLGDSRNQWEVVQSVQIIIWLCNGIYTTEFYATCNQEKCSSYRRNPPPAELNVDNVFLPNRSFGGAGAHAGALVRSDSGDFMLVNALPLGKHVWSWQILCGLKFALDAHTIVCSVTDEDESSVLSSKRNAMLILWHIPLLHLLHLTDENVCIGTG